MAIRIVVCGARGKMGQEAVQAIHADPACKLVGTCNRGDDLHRCIQDNHAQVVVDLTEPESVLTNAQTIIAALAHPVIGTTGLTAEHVAMLQTECAALQLGGVIAPNFSIAAALMIRMAEMATAWFPDAEIVEAHHPQKKDAPSGTALHTAQAMAKARSSIPFHSTHPQSPARGQSVHQIPIHAIRLPGYVAHQTVYWGSTGESLRIQHDCWDRKAFMPGLLLCCKAAPTLHRLVYGLDAILWPSGDHV